MCRGLFRFGVFFNAARCIYLSGMLRPAECGHPKPRRLPISRAVIQPGLEQIFEELDGTAVMGIVGLL